MKPFWKSSPIEPRKSWISILLVVSLALSGAGWAVYGVFSFAFEDIEVIPTAVQSWLVILGSALIVIGAEMNTAPTGVAVFHKVGKGKAHWLDYTAFVASLIGSLMGAWIVFSIRQTLLGEGGGWWRPVAMAWGPLVLGLMIAVDYYGAVIELGLLKADYEQDMLQWQEEELAWYAAQETPDAPKKAKPRSKPQEKGDRLPKEERQALVLAAFLSEDPPLQRDLAVELGVSRGTIRNDRLALKEAGRLNGGH